MDVKTNMVTCPNGHSYDSSLFPNGCPTCQSARSGNFAPTEDPGVRGAAAYSVQPVGPTQPADGHTNPISNQSPFDQNAPGNFGHTIIAPVIPDAPAGLSEPVVGWLVCIEGPVRGSDYRIHAGYNYIGRESGDIRIHGDNQISHENHAMIAFDSTELTYYVGPAAGRNLIKVNGKTVLNAVELSNYDIISIGTTKLIFVGLCGEKFSWSNGGAE